MVRVQAHQRLQERRGELRSQRDQPDLAEIQAIQALCGAPDEKILLMPEGIDGPTLEQRSAWLVELCKQHGYRFTPRLHILLYGQRRGV